MLDPFLIWLEATPLSTWLREDPSILAFPMALVIHAIGMALLVGTGVALSLRVLGVAPDVPVVEMDRFFPVMRTGLWLNVTSGIALLIAYPTKVLTNPVFYVKLLLIAMALGFMRSLRRQVFRLEVMTDPAPRPLRMMAGASLACWAAAITAGRLLAYTYTRLTALE